MDDASTSTSAPPPDALEPRRLIIATTLMLLAFMAIFLVIGRWFYDPMVEAGRWFVQTWGGPGVAVGFMVPDAFTVPIPNDAFLALGRTGNMATLPLVGWALLGSLCGGSLGFVLGRQLRSTAFFSRFMSGRGARVDRALRKHGIKVVAIAAVTPLPYSLSSWAAGATHMAYPAFLAISLLRIIRIVGVLYLIDLGLMTVT